MIFIIMNSLLRKIENKNETVAIQKVDKRIFVTDYKSWLSGFGSPRRMQIPKSWIKDSKCLLAQNTNNSEETIEVCFWNLDQIYLILNKHPDL